MTTTPTFKAVAPSASRPPGRATILKADRAIKKAALAEILKEHDLDFVYIRHSITEDFWVRGLNPKGGMVIAYKPTLKGGTIVEMATSLCSKHDIFDKIQGKFLAASNFAQGKTILVDLTTTEYRNALHNMFDF